MLEIVVCDDDIADLERAVNMLHKIFTMWNDCQMILHCVLKYLVKQDFCILERLKIRISN